MTFTHVIRRVTNSPFSKYALLFDLCLHTILQYIGLIITSGGIPPPLILCLRRGTIPTVAQALPEQQRKIRAHRDI